MFYDNYPPTYSIPLDSALWIKYFFNFYSFKDGDGKKS
jgi:hypothetical protein